jgi:ParB family transcriptional regulator, chromosome partitioning protein
MSERRRGLGRGLGALIPTAPPREAEDRDGRTSSPVDVFFPPRPGGDDVPRETAQPGAVAPERLSHEGADGSGAPAAGATVPESVPGLVAVQGAYFAEVPLESVTPNPRQPRQVFDEESMAELVHSIREIGLLQPVVVRSSGDGRYELVMGERRWRAAQEVGLETIPAIVRDTPDDDLLRDALLENLHRSQLNPLEEAAAYQQLLDDFGCTHEVLAERIKRSRPQISNTLRLLKLPPLVQRRVAAGVLSAGHARALLGLADGAGQERLAQRIVAEGLSVRAVEEIVALGGDPEPAARPTPTRRPVAPRLADLAAVLSERLDTRVKVDLGQRKGKVTIEFATIDDLERIVGTIAPDAVAHLGDTEPASD